jgi:hypothetical protein
MAYYKVDAKIKGRENQAIKIVIDESSLSNKVRVFYNAPRRPFTKV